MTPPRLEILDPDPGSILAALAHFRGLCAPEIGSRSAVTAALARLKSLTIKRDSDEIDTRLQVAAYLDELAAYPADVACEALRLWPREPDGRWWPAWADLAGLCDRLMEPRRAALAAIEAADRAASEADDAEMMTEAERHEAAAILAGLVAEWRRGSTAAGEDERA